MSRVKLTLLATVAMAGAGGAIAIADTGGGHDGHAGGNAASATLVDATGAKVGKVTFQGLGHAGPVLVTARASGLTPGFHGFHVHAVGRCDAPDFTSAGPHIAKPGQSHGEHVGDLPPLLAKADGTAYGAAVTDRFTLADLTDADGSAIMVHGGRDNLANIPDRYQSSESDEPGPDAMTLDTGDSGARVACGVVR
jgi:superoxide dismutase, Cu-Zn family